MDRELELAGAASAGGWLRWRAHHAVAPGTPCANCETPLQGPYCHVCGQLAESFERSLWHLMVEGVESFFHFDGRFWRTLPNLAIRPGQLTRNYLDGKRAGQIPPLRLFLVMLLVLFFVGGLNLTGERTELKTLDDLSPQERAKFEHDLGVAKLRVVGPSRSGRLIDLTESKGDGKAAATPARKKTAFETWAGERLSYAAHNKELFFMALETWGHRFAVLMLPIAALILSGLFVFQRRFVVFDHLIFSMHSLSFQGVLLTFVFLFRGLTPFAGVLLLAAPVHLFVHMRGTYGTSIAGTLLRMVLLFLTSFVAFTFLMLGLLWVGLSVMPPH
jgi:Protein of unknown function (DUF3667)